MIDVSVLENEFHAAQEAVTRQGDVVRSLKAAVKDGKAEKVCRSHASCLTSYRPPIPRAWARTFSMPAEGRSSPVPAPA